MPAPLPWYRSLAWTFFQGTALVLLAVTGLFWAVVHFRADRGAQEAAQRALGLAGRSVDQALRQEIRLLEAGLERFTAQSWNLGNLDEALRAPSPASARDTLAQNLPTLRADFAFLATPDGRRFASTLQGDADDASQATAVQMALDPEAAAQAGRPGPAFVGFMQVPGGPRPGPCLIVARPLRLPGGTALGAMGVGLLLTDPAALRLRDLSLVPERPPTHLCLLQGSRMVGTTLPALHRPPMEALLASAAFQRARAAVAQGQPSDGVPLTLDKGPCLAVLRPLRGEDAATLEMASLLILPLDPYLAPFRRIQTGILAAGSLGLLLALAAAMASARRVTAPLTILTRAAQSLAVGQRPDLPEHPKDDEVGTLTHAFRSLLAELQAKDELLGALERLRPAPTPAIPLDPDHDATQALQGTQTPSPTLSPGPRIAGPALTEGSLLGGRYRIESLLGRGGMGVVLRVRDLQLDEEVALKVIRPEQALSPAFLEQLKQEIRLARRITHRHVLRTHDFGEADGMAFVTMEYLRGVTLEQLREDRGRLPLALTLRIARQVSEGLEAAHSVGVVHRDVKPANVFFDLRGDVKLLDFGLAAPLSAPGANAAGQVFGTPRYMAPEQVRGEAVDPRTDLYALGVMLFELATGAPPFAPASVSDLLQAHLLQPPPALRPLAPDYPEAFAFLVERLLAKRIQDRPSSAAEVVEILKLLGREAEASWRG